MNWRNITLVGLLFLVVGLLTPKGQLLVMGYYDKLKSLITGLEGLRLEAYQDITGHWTIGYGHLIKPGEVYYPYGATRLITSEEAELIFQADTANAERCIDRFVVVPLTENQRAALVSFIFNTGCGAFQSSHLLQYVNAGDFVRAAEEFGKWVLSTQPDGSKITLAALVDRRAQEKQVFLA